MFILAIAGMLHAQSESVRFGFGPKIGISINTLSEVYEGQSLQKFYNDAFADSDISASEFNIGFNSGLFAYTLFANRIGLQLEFQLSGEGTGVTFTDKRTGDSYRDGDFNYINRYRMTNIPVLLQVHIKNDIRVYGGIQFSSIRKMTTLTGTRSGSNKPKEVPESDWSQSIDGSWMGGVFGASFEAEGFIIDGRLTFGPEIGKNPDVYGATPFSAQLTVGYNFMKLFGSQAAPDN